jgi:hypothetical protein
LHLAASTYQTTVECTLEVLLARAERFDYAAVKALAQPECPTIPELAVLVPDLASYDRLLAGGAS